MEDSHATCSTMQWHWLRSQDGCLGSNHVAIANQGGLCDLNGKHSCLPAGILCGSGSGMRHGALAACTHGQPEELHPAGECQEKKDEACLDQSGSGIR